MTAEKALELLNDVEFAEKYQGVQEYTEMLIVCKEALEKQIPKKPQYVDTRFRNHGRRISDGSSLAKCYKCPSCDTHIFHVFDDEKFCEHCGQALDWSDNNA